MSGADSGAERPSLDLGKNDSTSPDSPETEQSDDSERYDCRQVYQNFEFEQSQHDLEEPGDDPATAQFRCNSWDCYCCGYRMRQNLVEEIQRITSQRPELSRLLTLTLDPATAPDDQEDQHKYITERWNALRTRLRREIGDFSFIWVREEQENGLPHLHILVSRYLPQEIVSRSWAELGGGEVVDIRKIDHVDKAAHYVGKYLTKDALTGLPDKIQRYNSSSDIDLEVRGGGDSDEDWRLMMDDHEIRDPDDEPLRRPPAAEDFVRQREYGGPIPPPGD
jgi:hypothetical protein